MPRGAQCTSRRSVPAGCFLSPGRRTQCQKRRKDLNLKRQLHLGPELISQPASLGPCGAGSYQQTPGQKGWRKQSPFHYLSASASLAPYLSLRCFCEHLCAHIVLMVAERQWPINRFLFYDTTHQVQVKPSKRH